MSGIPKIDSYSTDFAISNKVDWKIESQRAVLLFHDMQHYFLRPFSTSGDPVASLISNSIRLHAACIKQGIPISYTTQPGDMTRQQRGLLRDFWGEGMTAQPEDRQVIEPILPRPEDWIFTKWRYSAFVKTNFLERMQAAGRDQLIVCGVYCHVGILATALEAFSYDIQPFVIADATADFSLAEHAMALDYISRRCGMVKTTEAILDDIEVMQ